MKLNNIFKIAGLSSMLLIGSTGCEDFLTKDHPTATTDDKFWKTMNECESALGQCRHGRRPDMAGMIWDLFVWKA